MTMMATSSFSSTLVAKIMSTSTMKMQCYIRLKYITKFERIMLLIDMIPASYTDASFRKFNHVSAISTLTPQVLIC